MASGKIKKNGWELLWTNPNPSASFAAQTVALDLSKYAEIKMLVVLNAESGAYHREYQMAVGYSSILEWIYNLEVSGGFMVVGRIYKISPTGISFQNATVKASNATSVSTDNIRLAPICIYAR